MSPNELAHVLYEKCGATMVTLFGRTEPKLTKKSRITGDKNPYLDDLVHEWGRNVVFGADYEAAIMRRWAEVGELSEVFKSDPLWRGKGFALNPYMRQHENGEVYLAYQLKTKPDGKVMGATHSVYKRPSTGETLDLEYLSAHYLPTKGKSKKQTKPLSEVQGASVRETHPRTIKLANVVELRMGGDVITLDKERIETLV